MIFLYGLAVRFSTPAGCKVSSLLPFTPLWIRFLFRGGSSSPRSDLEINNAGTLLLCAVIVGDLLQVLHEFFLFLHDFEANV